MTKKTLETALQALCASAVAYRNSLDKWNFDKDQWELVGQGLGPYVEAQHVLVIKGEILFVLDAIKEIRAELEKAP